MLDTTLIASPLPFQSTTPVGAVATPLASVDWVVTKELQTKYDGYFQGIDKDHDGYVSGEEAKSLFMASNLQQNILGHIWWVIACYKPLPTFIAKCEGSQMISLCWSQGIYLEARRDNECLLFRGMPFETVTWEFLELWFVQKYKHEGYTCRQPVVG